MFYWKNNVRRLRVTMLAGRGYNFWWYTHHFCGEVVEKCCQAEPHISCGSVDLVRWQTLVFPEYLLLQVLFWPFCHWQCPLNWWSFPKHIDLFFYPSFLPTALFIRRNDTRCQISRNIYSCFQRLLLNGSGAKICYHLILSEFIFKGMSSDVYERKQYLKDCAHI